MSSPAGTFNYAYDGDKNLISKQTIVAGLGTLIEAFTYDTMDRLATSTYPSGRQVSYTYDNRDWVTAVNNPAGGEQGYVGNIARAVSGAIQQISLGNGATSTYGFDVRYRVNSIGTSSPAGSVLNLGFTYDHVSNLMMWTDSLNSSNNRTFGYDPLHRLNDANAPGLWGDLTLGYDALGNRTSKGLAQGGQHSRPAMAYDQSNRLTAVTTGTGAESYGYDARGNRTSEVLSPTVTTTAVSGITGTTATSGGNVTWDAGASVTARGVCWATTANPTTSNSHTSDGTGTGTFTSSLTGLAPGTTYHVRAYATNSAGTGYGSTSTSPRLRRPPPSRRRRRRGLRRRRRPAVATSPRVVGRRSQRGGCAGRRRPTRPRPTRTRATVQGRGPSRAR